ncbi:MAG: NAD(P)H-dependent oxidoreductase [Ruminococcus sp.]|nr:NAD(P)H-dependent oxidoreductase [Ruminococcus sp.]
MLLFINACVRSCSRTKRLADRLLTELGGADKELKLGEIKFPVTDESYLRMRDRLIAGGEFCHEALKYAREFAAADTIVIAAPYWDLSFPAQLKEYIEKICVIGVTFGYTEDGQRIGLCKAKRLYYVTTSGGRIESEEFGFGYIKYLAQSFYGIEECVQFRAEGLDLIGADAEAILKKAEKEITEHFKR